MNKSLLFAASILLLITVTGIRAQNSYSFTQLTGITYTDLSGDIAVPGFDVNGLFKIPGLSSETFEFYDLDFTFGGAKFIAMGENPYLRIDNDSSIIIVDGAFTYADPIDASSRKSYIIEGAPGSRVLKLQYKNLKLRNGPALNFINVQIVFYQQTRVIEIHYGPRSSNNASGYTNLNGPNIGIFYSPLDFSGCYEKLWCEGSPSSIVLDSAADYGFDAMGGVPAEGTVYRFTPRFFQSATAVNESVEKGLPIKVYPCPADDELFIGDSKKINKVVLFNAGQQIVFETSWGLSEGKIDTSKLPKGLYFLVATDLWGHSSATKIVVSHR